MVLELQEKIFTEDVEVFFQDLLGSFRAVFHYGLWNLATEAGGGCDQSFTVFPEKILIHAGCVVKSFLVGP